MLTGGPDSYLLLSPLPNMETYKPQYAVSLKFSAMADTVYTYRDNRLISVNILIVYKRQENKTASGNSVVFFFFLFFFCLEGICRARMGILLCQRQSTPWHPCPATTHPSLHTEQILADMGGHSPDQSYIFFFTARSDASDLLSDVAWMIQTKTNALEFKNRS